MYAPSVARAASSAPSSRSRAPDPVAQLRRRLLGERDRQDRADVDAVLEHRAHEPLDEHRGLAAAGAGVEQQVARAPLDRDGCSSVQIIGLRQIPGIPAARRASTSAGTASARRCAAAVASATARAAASSSTSSSSSPSARRWTRRRPDRGALDEHAARRADHSRRAAGTGRRSASTLEQLADREHVQRHLQLAVVAAIALRPTRAGRCRSCSRGRSPCRARRSTSTRSITPRTVTRSAPRRASARAATPPRRRSRTAARALAAPTRSRPTPRASGSAAGRLRSTCGAAARNGSGRPGDTGAGRSASSSSSIAIASRQRLGESAGRPAARSSSSSTPWM